MKRYVLLTKSLDTAAAEVERSSGKVVRAMEAVSGLLVELPEPAVDALVKRLENAKLLPDTPVAAAGKPGGGSVAPAPQTVPWGETAIRAPLANAVTSGDYTRVCIVDSGIDRTHPDLAGSIVDGRNFVASGKTTQRDRWIDDYGHGTHVAGTVAARNNGVGVVGAAPRASLVIAKVLDATGNGSASAVLDATGYCINSGARVVLMAFTSTQSALLKAAVDLARGAGASIVAAAGNNYGGGVEYPAAESDAVAVGAVGMFYDQMEVANYSAVGASLDVVAPGTDILSTAIGGGYARWSGTSMAAAHVAGVLALQLAAGKSDFAATELPGWTREQQGRGLIDALATVQQR
jgi:subtilisin